MSLQNYIVRPIRPIIPGVDKLGPLDQYTVRMYMPMACLFHVDSPELRSTILKNLQTSLSRTIEDVKFLAATIVPECEETDTIQLQYEENCGVIESINYQDLLETHLLCSREFVERYIPEPRLHDHDRAPVFSAQATFINGGLVLAFSPHHSIMDAQGFATVMDLWAKHAAADSDDRILGDEARPTRETMDPYFAGGPGYMKREDFAPYQTPGGVEYGVRQAQIMASSLAGDSTLKTSHWLMSPDDVARLQVMAVPPSTDLPTETANSVVAAFIWQKLSAAWHKSGHEDASSALFSAVNVRRRMDPPMPPDYMRNAIVLSRAQADAKNLHAPSSDVIYDLARKISTSVDYWTPEQIYDLMSAIESWPKTNARLFPPLNLDIFLTSPASLGKQIWESKWGQQLGAVKAIRCAANAYLDGMVIMMPTADGGRDIMIFTMEEVLSELKADAEWTSRACYLG
ncbi:unnamed protein product [Penicillium bialowiezense]